MVYSYGYIILSDTYFVLFLFIILRGSAELFLQWINVERGGIRIGNDRWGVKIYEVENFSNATLAAYAAEKIINTYNPTFFFGPVTSGITKPVVNVTDTYKKVLMSTRANAPHVFDGSFKYAFGMLSAWPPMGIFEDTFGLYAAKGAKKIGVICDKSIYYNVTNSYGNYVALSFCDHVKIDDLMAEVTPHGMTVSEENYFEILSTSDYSNDLYEAVLALSKSNIDVLIILCNDALGMSYRLEYLNDVPFMVDAINYMKELKVGIISAVKCFGFTQNNCNP